MARPERFDPEFPEREAPTNGDHVTWRELNLVLRPMWADLKHVRETVDCMAERYSRGQVLGPRGQKLLHHGATKLVGLATSTAALGWAVSRFF